MPKKKEKAVKTVENKPEEKMIKTACIRFGDINVLVTLTLPDKVAEATIL